MGNESCGSTINDRINGRVNPALVYEVGTFQERKFPFVMKGIMDSLRFPTDFLWGAATASYQIEGGWNEDNKGESIWDRFSHTPGKITNNETGDVACDHYHRYPEDIALMRQLGLRAYRFSISWPRVLPNGFGRINPAGLDYYDHLVDTLLAANIEPFITLHHWDYPQALQDRGGWVNRDNLPYFADFAALMVKRLGDRVRRWATLNEPDDISENDMDGVNTRRGLKTIGKLSTRSFITCWWHTVWLYKPSGQSIPCSKLVLFLAHGVWTR
jgi:Glycosyl hydrolase family 1